MDSINKLVQSWVALRKIPGAVLEISLGGKLRWSKAWGSYSDGTITRPIYTHTIFDAASLTKVTATLPALLLLIERHQLSLDDKVKRFIPGFRYEEMSIRQLLQHSSGLPADLPSIDRYEPRTIMQQELIYEPGTQAVYSDLGFILLGRIIEELTRETLAVFATREIFTPLAMKDTLFLPGPSLRERIAATESNEYANGNVHSYIGNDVNCKNGFIVGEVHDEKCYQMGGISGSAGLFTTAGDLVKYGESWLADDSLISTKQRTACVTAPFQGRGLGWEVWQGQTATPSCGQQWPMGSYGHTGFTGTSLWIEPQNKLVVVFMTNAIHFGRSNPIRELRPLLHGAIYSSLITTNIIE
jgi:CubicO group peptidase (beta-lactamase class C family)